MQVASVRCFLLSYPLPTPLKLRYFGGERTIFKRDAMLIRVATDNGLVGYAPGQATESARNVIESTIARFLEGRKIADTDALRVLFAKTDPGEFALKVYSAVEIALYDLMGKARGVPVSELVGGRIRDRIRLYGSAGMYMAPEKYAEEAAAVAALGFRAYKMRPALGPEEDLRTIRLIREATGLSFDLMVDAHTWWRMGNKSYETATVERLAEQFSQYEIAWLEEPMQPDDHEGYQRLKEANFVPLASGEHEPNEAGFMDLIMNSSVDFVQMDVVCQGGYPLGRRVIREVADHELKFAFHSWGTALEVVAAAHLGICWPPSVTEWLEYPCYSTPKQAGMYPFPLSTEMLIDPLEIDDGDLIVSREPGLGVTVDEGVIERYPWVPGPWSTFTLESPRETWAVTGDHSTRWANS